jgi:predicted CDP-diglyceride synthetase/phosphatidate cytidylyltransferase
MIKFIDKIIKKYVNDIRISKWNVVKFGALFAFFVCITSFTYNKVVDKLSTIDSAIIASGAAIIMGIMWAIFSIMVVAKMDKLHRKEEELSRKIINDKRLKVEMAASGKKINNKKKKKYRKLLQEQEINRRDK